MNKKASNGETFYFCKRYEVEKARRNEINKVMKAFSSLLCTLSFVVVGICGFVLKETPRQKKTKAPSGVMVIIVT